MPRITIDGNQIECREGISVLQAALDAGIDAPHYCYHPGLSVVASCRVCLMEMKVPNPRTGESDWLPKLVPSCQTKVSEGMEVRYKSAKVEEARSKVLEFLLIDHPLDCPVCDQAGECLLQDYSRRFGCATSRMDEDKFVDPKKNIGSKTMLYQDRCIQCTRCVRFAREIAGTGELCVVNRGHKNEIDVFPGQPLENELQGNVVDLCPVGSMLDKDFLFAQRVWELKGNDSICPGCATGCAIRIDQNKNTLYRVKPRYNPGVNDWWICDTGRFYHKALKDRLTATTLKGGDSERTIDGDEAGRLIAYRLKDTVAEHGAGKIAVVLSPFLANEEIYLLVKAVHKVDPQAVFARGPVPTETEDQVFPIGSTGEKVKFRIHKDRCPNRRGVELVLGKLGVTSVPMGDLVSRMREGRFATVWITGGYRANWADDALVAASGNVDWLLVHDLFPGKLTENALLTLAMCSFAEREGSYINADDKIQPFNWAVRPPDGFKREGQLLLDIARTVKAVEYEGLYNGEKVRRLMAGEISEFENVWTPPLPPPHQH